MMELMEVKTSMSQPDSVELKDPAAWKDATGIKDFLASTQDKSITDLILASKCLNSSFQTANYFSTLLFLVTLPKRV